ncbi:MAG: IS3 family transposase [Chloroflexota bacterium]
MALRIRAIHEARPPDLRHPRVHAELRESGEQAGKHRVARLMTHMGLKTRCRRRFRVTTQANAQRTPAPNLLAQDFSATRPNQKWLVDITYLATREGWLYLAGVLDTYSRRIVGWSMSERLTEPLVCDALCMALAQGGAPDLHHSDQGSQYTAHAYLALLEKAHIRVSISAVGRCYDNAIKRELLGDFETRMCGSYFPYPSLSPAGYL